MRTVMRLGAALLCSCTGQNQDTDWQNTTEFTLSAEVLCSDPVPGVQRLSEQSERRGLLAAIEEAKIGDMGHMPGLGADLVATDFDADGDIDILAGGLYGEPLFFENDAHGYFQQVLPPPISLQLAHFQTVMTWGATDLNGDLLPEIIYGGVGQFAVLVNQGDWSFRPHQKTSFGDQGTPPHNISFTLGDADQDGDLDLFIPTNGPTSEGGETDPEKGSPDVLFLLNSDREFEEALSLTVGTEGSRSQVAAFTDRDQDGDMDLLALSDLGPPSSFFRNDGLNNEGLPVWVDDAEDLHADLKMSAMGIDSADLNHDGWLDYCASDIGLPKCLMSDGTGGYYDGHAALGFALPAEFQDATHAGTIGWSIDLADLDNDGHVDLVQASGPNSSAYQNNERDIPDAIWMRQSDGTYQNKSTEMGFDSTANHIGMASADFNGDGYLDLAVAGPGKTIDLHMNECGDNAWVEVELIGPKDNSEGLGAQVQATWGTLQETREIHGLRAHGQGPSRAHFGLGQSEVLDSLTVRWPDGHISEAENLPVRRQVIVRHPKAVSGKFESNVQAKPFNEADNIEEGWINARGEVIDLFNQQPVENAEVWDESAPESVVITDSDGAFSIPLPRDASLNLVAIGPDTVPTLIPVNTTFQSTAKDGISLSIMSPAQLEDVYSFVLEGEQKSEHATLFTVLRNVSGGQAIGATVRLETEHDAVMSVGPNLGTETDTLQEGHQVMIFFNAKASQDEAQFFATSKEGVPCQGPGKLALRPDTITMAVYYCP
jgi:hypothetical protein